MKDNKGTEILSDLHGKRYGNNFSVDIVEVSERRGSCYCSRCFHHLGDITYKISYAASVESKNIRKKTLDNILPVIPSIGAYAFPAKCPKCKEETPHVVVDAGIGDLIQKLNLLGLKTLYSCEMHNLMDDGTFLPYIAFRDNVSEHFDMNHPLLKDWTMETYKKKSHIVPKSILRVSKDAPIRHVTDDIAIDNLKEYVNTVLSEKLGNESNE